MQKQNLKQKLGLNITPQQIQFLGLLQIPITSLNARIQEEIEDNPALEESEELENLDPELNINDHYKTYNNFNEPVPDFQLSNHEESLQDHLKKQILLFNLSERDLLLIEYLIDSLDDSGYLNRDLYSIASDIEISLGIQYSEKEVSESLLIIQKLEPFGVGARSLQECLMIQLKNKQESNIIKLAIKILETNYNAFSKKNFELILKSINISKSRLSKVYEIIEKLNPYPASNFNENTRTEYIVPDFKILHIDGKQTLIVNKSDISNLAVNSHYLKLQKETSDLKTKKFLKDKIDAALWFKEAISQRNQTLFKVMNVIFSIQQKYFVTSDESDMLPMKLADISEVTGLDLSTISRVSNSKYVETHFGTFLLKDLFSEAYRKDNGEVVSTNAIKKKLSEIIEKEDKKNPYTDELLCELLGESEYFISRRTVAKYRDKLNIRSSKYRRLL
tara:strand:+ start:1373 stop:2716 length:1344 start_codon:yes stop_codon:yes gene_type:complete